MIDKLLIRGTRMREIERERLNFPCRLLSLNECVFKVQILRLILGSFDN
jgi:hypothetical protein